MSSLEDICEIYIAGNLPLVISIINKERWTTNQILELKKYLEANHDLHDFTYFDYMINLKM